MVPAHDAGTGLEGRALGETQRGGPFVLDPFDAYASGLVSNPNVIVAGSIGAGKSTVVKMMLDRALERGRRAVIIDPKGEYAQLARVYDVDVVALGRDGWCSPFPSNDRESRDLLRALIASAQGAPLKSDQHYVIDEVWQALDSPRPPRVLRALFESLQSHLASTTETPERSLALTLYRFIHGDLAGLFDGADEPMLFTGQLVVLDLSAQWSSNSFSVAALSAVAAAQQVAAVEHELGYLVLDEAWSLLGDPHALRGCRARGNWRAPRDSVTCWSCIDGVTSPRSATWARPIANGRGDCFASARRRGCFVNRPTKPARWRWRSDYTVARRDTSRRCPRVPRSCATERTVRSCEYARTREITPSSTRIVR
jgi:hypothetical protein